MAKRESLYVIKTDVAAAMVRLWLDEKAADEVGLETSGAVKADGLVLFGEMGVSGIGNERDLTACLHGYKQKVGDKGAKSAGDNGKVDQLDRVRAVMAEFARLAEGGQWNSGATGGGGLGVDGNILVDAFAEAYPKYTREEVVAKVKALAGPVRAKLLTTENPLTPFINAAREKAAARVSEDAVGAALAGFADGE